VWEAVEDKKDEANITETEEERTKEKEDEKREEERV